MSGKQGEDASCHLLEVYREEIDLIDEKLLELLQKRQEMALRVGQLKMENGIDVVDSARESEVMRKLLSRDHGVLTKQTVERIFSEIMSAARSVQRSLTMAHRGGDRGSEHQG